MTCDETRKLLQDYIDGEIAGSAAQGIKKHIADCAACRKEADELEAISRALTSLKTLRAPALAVERTKAQVRSEAARARQRQAWSRGALAAIAAALVIAVTLLEYYGVVTVPGKFGIDTEAVKTAAVGYASGALSQIGEYVRPYTSTLPEPIFFLKLAGIAAAVLVAVAATAEESVARQLQRKFHI